MSDNLYVRDALGVSHQFRTKDLGSNLHVPHHRLDNLNLTGPATQSAINTDLLTGTVNGWYDTEVFFSGAVQILASADISTGAIFFEQTNDNTSTTGVPLEVNELGVNNANTIITATSIAANTRRMFSFGISSRYIRVRISTAFVGGTVQAVAVLTQQPFSDPSMMVTQTTGTFLNTQNGDNTWYQESVTAQAANAVLTGTSRNVGAATGNAHAYSKFNVFALADQTGTMRIEISNDNTTWRRATADTAVAVNTPVILSIPVIARYFRVVYTNGATLQTLFHLNTSFTAG